MKVKPKLLIISAVILILFVITITIFIINQRRQINLLYKSNLEQHIKLTNNIYDYNTVGKKKILNDYTYYDELVDYVNHPDKEWADNNIGTMIDAFDLNYVWIFDLNNNCLYEKKESNKLPEINIKSEIFKKLYNERFCTYYLTNDSLIIEIIGATIHYTNDPERIYNPNGFLLIGKIWDENYIDELESLTQSKIRIFDPYVTPSDSVDRSTVISSIVLKDWNTIPIKSIQFSRIYPFIYIFIELFRMSLLALLVLGVILVLLFIFSYQKIIFKPLKLISSSLIDGNPSNLEEVIRKKDEFAEVGSLIKNFFEQKTKMVKFIEDKDRAIKELVESERRYKSLFDNSMVGVIITKNERIINANRAALEIFGLSDIEEAVNHSIFEFAIPESRKYLLLRLDRISKKLPVEDSYSLKVKHKNGSIINIEINTKDIVIQNENYRLSTVRDITDKSNFENELKLEKAYFEQLFESSPAAVVVTDSSNNILKTNKAFTRLFGYIPPEAIGQSVNNLIVPDFLVEESNEIIYKIINNETVSIETVRKNKFNELIDVSILATPIIAGEGLIAYYGIYHDITKQKKVEKILREAKDKAEDSDRLKSSFLANISHEIRTPMNGIVGFTELLKSKHTSYEERKVYLDYITISINQLLGIFNNVVEISLLDSQQLEINNTECDIENIMQQLHQVFEKERKLKEKEHIVINYNQPETNIESRIITDPVRLQQILSNMLSNALKFTIKGSITFGYELQDGWLQFYVKDTGIGIPEDKHSIIFNRFRQVDESTTRVQGGTGLGLAISKGIAELLGGRIWFKSTVYKGSEFYLSIPYESAVNALKIGFESQKNSIISKNDLKNKTVLVAEDADSNYLFIEVLLSKTNANVIRASNGKDAIELCRKNKNIDIVLMDLYMPVISGIEATKQIKSIRPSLPIIALTAYVLENDREKSIEAGCDDYLTKPIDINQLFELINHYLNIQ